MSDAPQTKTVYITIGNSDHKLSQYDWASFYEDVASAVRFASVDMGSPIVYGEWTSESSKAYQNACWCVELTVPLELRLRRMLALAARTWTQDSISWAEVSGVDHIKPHQ